MSRRASSGVGSIFVIGLGLLAPGCSHGGRARDDGGEQRSPRERERERERERDEPKASSACPRSPALDDPAQRVDQPLDEHAFARCDFEIFGPTEITSLDQFRELVQCADPPGHPSVDFAAQRLMTTRVEAPSSVLGATREADGRIVVHVLRPGICSGVDWGNTVHVVVLPNDGSEVEVDVCAEPSTCGPGEMPP